VDHYHPSNNDDRTEEDEGQEEEEEETHPSAVPQIDLTLLESPVKGRRKETADVGAMAEAVAASGEEEDEVEVVERAIEELPSVVVKGGGGEYGGVLREGGVVVYGVYMRGWGVIVMGRGVLCGAVFVFWGVGSVGPMDSPRFYA
jgi:hypothetical protein